jgi:hypothetical protein
VKVQAVHLLSWKTFAFVLRSSISLFINSVSSCNKNVLIHRMFDFNGCRLFLLPSFKYPLTNHATYEKDYGDPSFIHKKYKKDLLVHVLVIGLLIFWHTQFALPIRHQVKLRCGSSSISRISLLRWK